ncbi:hypothetical protein ACFTZB_04985 [Rhodococcus sp. NPDC057014]|uniref:hypothetical protein n=1 Tax=Rhodococcus sp. NPDC057014 TaxID=3346000 RepID=UPI00363993DD
MPAELSAAYVVPDNIGFNFRWTAEPGIDLASRESTVVRAYLESYYIALGTHSVEKGYPGFLDATAAQVGRWNYGGRSSQPVARYTGTQFEHLLWLSPTPRGWFATVCTGDYAVTRLGDDGKYYNIGSTSVGTEEIELVAPTTSVVDSVALDSVGPERAPAQDMFAGWTIRHHQPATASIEADRECDSRMPDARDVRPQKVNLPHDAPYPTLAPFPGWPRYDEN